MNPVLQALLQAMQEKKVDARFEGQPYLPLNEAAIAEQKRHEAAVQELAEMRDKTVALYNKTKTSIMAALEAELNQWGDAMRVAMPELKDVEEFWVSEDGTQYKLPKPDTAQPGKPQQPDWAKEMYDKMMQDIQEKGDEDSV